MWLTDVIVQLLITNYSTPPTPTPKTGALERLEVASVQKSSLSASLGACVTLFGTCVSWHVVDAYVHVFADYCHEYDGGVIYGCVYVQNWAGHNPAMCGA